MSRGDQKTFFPFGFKAEPEHSAPLQDGMLANFQFVAPQQDTNEAHFEKEAIDSPDLTNPVRKK